MLRVLGVLFVAALAVALLFAACVSACGVAVVSVVAEGAAHIVAPVPLVLPLAAVRLAPEHLFDEDFDALGRTAILALGDLLESLETVEDAVLVEVTGPKEQVLVAKEDGDLVVRVLEDGERGARVRIRAPIRALAEAAESCRGAPPGCSRHLLRSLLTHASGTRIEVEDGETEVRISVW